MTDDAPDREAEQEQAALLSGEFQRQLWAVANQPERQWARLPHIAAHGAGEFFLAILLALTEADPTDRAFGLRLIDQVQQAFMRQTGAAVDAPAGETKH